MPYSRAEQETTISFMRDAATVAIYTSNHPHLQRLRRLASASATSDFVKEVAGDEDWGDFRVDAANFKLFSAIRKPRTLTPAQRQAAADRLAAGRAQNATSAISTTSTTAAPAA